MIRHDFFHCDVVVWSIIQDRIKDSSDKTLNSQTYLWIINVENENRNWQRSPEELQLTKISVLDNKVTRLMMMRRVYTILTLLNIFFNVMSYRALLSPHLIRILFHVIRFSGSLFPLIASMYFCRTLSSSYRNMYWYFDFLRRGYHIWPRISSYVHDVFCYSVVSDITWNIVSMIVSTTWCGMDSHQNLSD